jgi:phenylalanyl-tRNA synthetase beta chain
MKVSLNWIKDFVDLNGIDIREIVSRFSLCTAEIEGYEEKGTNISGVIVAEVKTREQHPKSQKLSLLTVDTGSGIVPIVCGAPNARAGIKVALATVGAQLGDMKIGIATLAGCESHGMCCSAKELGISNDHEGIIELDKSAKVGTPINSVIELKDTILEIDNKSITNRPDLWGHYGIARELSAIFDKKLKPLVSVNLDDYATLPKVSVKIDNKADCLSYGAIRVQNITQKNASLQMQTRLFYCGINPHGLLVDLTNYIMLETGQPSHAFDAAKVGKISVGNEGSGEFVTLKDQVVKVTPEMLFIKSDNKPVALAGVIGGKNSEIDTATQDCVFEFATFSATSVRKTSIAIGTRTDASNRFEKSLDTNLNVTSCARLLKLLKDADKGATVTSAFSYLEPGKTKTIGLTINKAYLEKFAGVKFDYKRVQRHLTAIGFQPVMTDKDIAVTVPTWRATKDVTNSADLVEEVVRLYGYDVIPATAPNVVLKPVEQLPSLQRIARMKQLLVDKYALVEVHTYLWNDTALNKKLNIEIPCHLRVLNSCIKENDAIRSKMCPSLICAVARNKKLDEMSIFEIGQVVSGLNKDGTAIEDTVLELCLSSKIQSAEFLYKKLATIVRDIFDLCGYRVKYRLGDRKSNYLHPKNNATVLINGVDVGGMAIVHPITASAIDPKMNLVVVGIRLNKLDGLGEKHTESVRVSKYQKSTLDFTFMTDKIYGFVEDAFDGFTHPLNMGFRFVDVFQEADGRLSYTLQFTVGSYEKTLESADIENVWQAIINHGKAAGLSLKE